MKKVRSSKLLQNLFGKKGKKILANFNLKDFNYLKVK